jgi:hypothetical protein
MSYTGYWITDTATIFGPRGDTGHWVTEGHIYGPSGYTECWIDGENIFSNTNGYIGWLDGEYIYGTMQKMPWIAE